MCFVLLDDITLSNRSASVTAPLTISFQVDLQNVRAKISVEIIVMSVARLRFKTYEGWSDKDLFDSVLLQFGCSLLSFAC